MEYKKGYLDQPSQFWCYFCQIQFISRLQVGKDIILCPKCNHDFCEIKTRFNHPQKFKPFQKQPNKKEKYTKKIDKRSLKITVNQLAQILQIEESQNFDLTEQMMLKLRKSINQSKQCSVCRVDLQIGETGLVPNCNHAFHEECLVEWIKRKNTCPTCRQKIIDC